MRMRREASEDKGSIARTGTGLLSGRQPLSPGTGGPMSGAKPGSSMEEKRFHSHIV